MKARHVLPYNPVAYSEGRFRWPLRPVSVQVRRKLAPAAA